MAVQDGFGLNDSNITGNVSFNSTEAARFNAELTGYSIDRNLDTLDNTVNRSVALVDGLIDQTYGFAQTVTTQANQQVDRANAQATKVTSDTLAGARALIGDQQTAINKLAADNTKLGIGLADVAIKAWTPTDNKALDAIKTMGMVAAAAAAAAFIFRAKKS